MKVWVLSPAGLTCAETLKKLIRLDKARLAPLYLTSLATLQQKRSSKKVLQNFDTLFSFPFLSLASSAIA